VNTILMTMTFAAFVLAMGIRYATQAFVAAMMGDGSPARDRRLTLNPARQLAPLGTMVALISAFPAQGFLATSAVPIGLGWGKPIRPNSLRLSAGPNAGLVIIGLSGIVVNLLVGSLAALLLALLPIHSLTLNEVAIHCGNSLPGGALQSCLSFWQPAWALRLEQFVFVFASVNLLIGLLNIIPLFPLDGYHILFAFLPTNAAVGYRNNEFVQEMVLVGLLFFLPFLLQIIGAPPTLNPFYWLQVLSYTIIDLFTVPHYGDTLVNIFINL
jgi:Zn-dependent protease